MGDWRVSLLPGERVVRVQHLDPLSGVPARSAIRALMALCSASRVDEIGVSAPVMASSHKPEHAGLKELTKFEALFGRDSLITARFVNDRFPRLTAVTVRELARVQGTRFDRVSEEEPGRIAHEIRDPSDPIAQAITESDGWTWPYYGAIDSTPLFISAVARLARSGWRVDDLRPHFVRAIDWLLRRLSEGDGLLVSRPSNPRGIANQVWKDSWDAFSHRDGSIARPPLAPTDAQASAYDACVDGAELLDRAGTGRRRAAMLRRAADEIQTTVMGEFWVTEGKHRFPALGVDWSGQGGTRRPIGARGSNMGQLLFSRLLDGAEFARPREAIVRALFGSDMLCAAGIRTIGSGERRYRPGAYHNGSSWPWDTATIALGLDRHGYHRLASVLMEKVVRVCSAAGAFPEFARGDSESRILFNKQLVDVSAPDGRLNRIEQPPQAIQAFTVGAVLAAKWRCGRRWTATSAPDAGEPLEAELEAEFGSSVEAG